MAWLASSHCCDLVLRRTNIRFGLLACRHEPENGSDKH
jgi:hypothetical protein